MANPLISKYSSREEWLDNYWQKLIQSKDILKIIITPHERRDLVIRAAAIDLIQSGKSYRQISKELWLSPQTISCLKKALAENGYKSYQERSKTERKKKNYSQKKKGGKKSYTPNWRSMKYHIHRTLS